MNTSSVLASNIVLTSALTLRPSAQKTTHDRTFGVQHKTQEFWLTCRLFSCRCDFPWRRAAQPTAQIHSGYLICSHLNSSRSHQAFQSAQGRCPVSVESSIRGSLAYLDFISRCISSLGRHRRV